MEGYGNIPEQLGCMVLSLGALAYCLYTPMQSRYVRIKDHIQAHNGIMFCVPGPFAPYISSSNILRMKISSFRIPTLMMKVIWLLTALEAIVF